MTVYLCSQAMVRKHMRKHVFSELETIKQGHSTVRDIVYTQLEYPQVYLTSSLFTNTQKSPFVQFKK